MADEYGVVASPRSFNNRAGLSRAINENLDEGTRIFIAEMGTYGPGEIRELTSWCPPEIAVVTAIGPVHLERMGTLEVVEAAKREITERASTVVLNIDDPRLAAWASVLRAEGKRVDHRGLDESPTPTCESRSTSGTLDGQSSTARRIADVDEIVGVQPTNLACALGGRARARRRRRAHRRSVSRGCSPVAESTERRDGSGGHRGRRRHLQREPRERGGRARHVLASLELTGRRVVVTPGWWSSGASSTGRICARRSWSTRCAAELVVVGRTNIVALAAGSSTSPATFDTTRGRRRSGCAPRWARETPSCS